MSLNTIAVTLAAVSLVTAGVAYVTRDDSGKTVQESEATSNLRN